jgi:hypothetical protein
MPPKSPRGGLKIFFKIYNTLFFIKTAYILKPPSGGFGGPVNKAEFIFELSNLFLLIPHKKKIHRIRKSS